METFARGQLESAHRDVLRRRRNNEHRRFRTNLPGGKTSIKDPVYEAVAASDSFARLLHELPLYLNRKSLLAEHQDLYQRVLRLYATRNKLVHRGAAPEDEKHLPLTFSGSVMGLRTAIDVIAWFGDRGSYAVWEGFSDLVTGAREERIGLEAG